MKHARIAAPILFYKMTKLGTTASEITALCVVRLSALGDVLMCVPLIRTLQAHYPKASLTWVISRPAYSLVEGMDGVEFLIIDKPNRLSDYWHFKKKIEGRKFDVLLATQASFRANLLYPLIRAKRKIGYDSLRAKDGHGWFVHETIGEGRDHTLEGFLRFADALGIEKKEVRWDLPISPGDYDWAHAHLPPCSGPLILVNPAASKAERSWLLDRYIKVIQYVQSRWNAEVVLIGGPGEHDHALGEGIAKVVTVTNLIGKTKPKQLLAVISQADVLLCPDTGPSHMGVAVGTPVVALHAVTSAEVSGPYTYRHLAVDCYPMAVGQILKKTEDTNIWGTHAHGAETMALISVEAVTSQLDRVLSEVRQKGL